MGGGSSKLNEKSALHKTEAEVCQLMLPVYYNDAPITNEEMDSVSNSWKLILTNTSPEFMAKRKDPTFPYPTCIMYFYNSFYERLFDIHPMAKALFKDMGSQGKFLVKMISLSLSEKADPVKYDKTLTKLAEIHCERGVKAVEYGLVGEVLFWSIKQCIGRDLFTPDVHNAWIKVYSRMLKTMVPVAVVHEMKDGSAQRKRFVANVAALTTSPSEDSTFLPKKPAADDDHLRLNETLQAVIMEAHP